ncbi:MAG: hypothetical protein GY749_04350 [Desulfobacteraceae bacterium]|nr:hypothetical protein [Desulfobacteraceae bacterium]
MIQHQLKSEEHAPEVSFGEMLPTMYDLPSENPEEPGVPDQFHTWQSELLTQTFVPPDYAPDRMMVGSDLNLYYDLNNRFNYKRPDWFAVLDVPYLYENREGRLSYVIWNEKTPPFIVIELLSPSTKNEDLGRTQRKSGKPPTKWKVYEQILGVPYYIVYNRYKDRLRAFQLKGGQYCEILVPGNRMWLAGLNLGLGVWSGSFHTWERKWLRWYDADHNWIPTIVEQAEQEKHRAEQEKHRAEQEKHRADQEKHRAESERQRADILAAKLRELGIDPVSLK